MTTPSAEGARPADAGRASSPDSDATDGTGTDGTGTDGTGTDGTGTDGTGTDGTGADGTGTDGTGTDGTGTTDAPDSTQDPAGGDTQADPDTPASDGAQPLLHLVNIGKSFGPVRVLTGVTLDIPVGQVTAVVGDNGAGKSTLIKTIAGIYQPDEGQIIWQGRQVHLHSPKAATDLGIATVYQDLALADNLDIVANMFLGQEQVKHFQLDEIGMEKAAKRTLADLSVVTVRSVRQPVGSLSGGQRQAVAVARAVMRQARLVILDEPTAALGVTQTRVVLDLIKRLKSQNIAVIVISHNLTDVQSVADRIAVLRLGRLVAVGPASQYDTESIVALMTTGTSRRLAATSAEPSAGSSSEH